MLKFLVFDKGRPARHWPVRNAYLLGSDGSAMRTDITFERGTIICTKREVGPAALALQMPVGSCGELTIATCLLPDRQEPYLLSLELARSRIMMLYNKLEDWGMFDIGPDHVVTKRTERAKKLFIEALCHQGSDLVKADQLAKDALIGFGDNGVDL